jgi:hypothetical protein
LRASSRACFVTKNDGGGVTNDIDGVTNGSTGAKGAEDDWLEASAAASEACDSRKRASDEEEEDMLK